MTLKKKLIMLVVLVLSLTLCCFGLVACGGNNDVPPNNGQQTGTTTPSGGEEGGSTDGSTSDDDGGSTDNEEPEESIDWTLVYTVSDDGSTITGLTEYGKTLSKIVIPKTLNEKAITSIGEDAFEYCYTLTSVTISDSVTSIGNSAFYDCYKINKVNYTGTVDKWAQINFGSASSVPIRYSNNLYINNVLLTEANVNTATKINDYAFAYCTTLTSVIIGNGVTSIGNKAFHGSALTSITIGNGVTSIGEDAFGDCYKLVEIINKSSINITKGSSNYGYVGKYALNVKTSGESDVVNQNGYLFYAYNGTNYLVGYAGKETALTLPDKYDGQNYEIYQYAFYQYTLLTSVTIGNGATSIGEKAFWNCPSLKTVTIGSGVTSIGNYAFAHCTLLTDATIGSGVSIIGDYAFWQCSKLTGMGLPDSVTSIGDYSFKACTSLTSMTIGSGVTTIGEEPCDECYKLVEIINKSSVTIEAGSSWEGGNMGHYTLNVKTEGESDIVNKNGCLFYVYDGTNYLIGYVGEETELTLLDKYDGQNYEIYDYAFYDCDSLTSITIGSGVTNIGTKAFLNCDSLTSVTFENTEGWIAVKNSASTVGTDLTLTDAEQNATYLTNTYKVYYWKHK